MKASWFLNTVTDTNFISNNALEAFLIINKQTIELAETVVSILAAILFRSFIEKRFDTDYR